MVFLKRAALMDPAKANCSVQAGQAVSSDTTYLTVADKEGNIVKPPETSHRNGASAGHGNGKRRRQTGV